MIRRIIMVFPLFWAIAVSAQVGSTTPKQIKGEITGRAMDGDSIFFRHGNIDNKYFEAALMPAALINNRYTINNNLSHPEMYKIVFASDRDKLAWRAGYYFVDATTSAIKTDYAWDNCSEVNGTTAHEYQYRFIPFVTKGMAYDCKSNYLAALFDDQNKKADSLVLNYVMQYPGSYVALWKLIERFSMWGQSAIRLQTLNRFSAKIKTEKLWKLLNEDFKSAKIKDSEKFPVISLKNYDLSAAKFTLPKAKYTLIDYWFARCRPCLDTIPVLKKLYADHHGKGFEIVGISVDETVNVPIWQRRVKEHALDWKQYLEENNFRVNELGIKSFPTFILLDNEGKVIWRDFDLHELDKFLTAHLG